MNININIIAFINLIMTDARRKMVVAGNRMVEIIIIIVTIIITIIIIITRKMVVGGTAMVFLALELRLLFQLPLNKELPTIPPS